MSYQCETKDIEEFRDLWVFSYLCNGINFMDLLFLQYSNIMDGEICFVRSKTSRTTKHNKEIHAIITPEMWNIIQKWGNPRLSPQTYIFKYATVLKRGGAKTSYISESLGHSNLSVTEHYLAYFEKEERIRNAQLLTNFNL